MARPPRIEFPGAIYHVAARGNAREAIFRDDMDWLLSHFAKTRPVAQRRYAECVAQGGNLPSPWPELKDQVLLGSEALVAKMRPLLNGKWEIKGIPALSAGCTGSD